MSSSWRNKIQQHPWYQHSLRRMQRATVNNVSLYRSMRVFLAKVTQTNLHHQANAIAFSFTLSIFPTLIFLFTLIPYIPIPNLTAQVMELVHDVLPEALYVLSVETIYDIVDRPRGDLLSFGFVFALYAATSGVIELIDTFNSNYRYAEKRSFFYKRLLAVGLAFLFAFLLLIIVAVQIVGHFVLEALVAWQLLTDTFLYYLFWILRYVVVFLVFFAGISVIYYVAPATETSFRFVSMGASIAAILIIVSTNLFSYYLANFATYNRLYGSIGTMIAFMLWLYMLAWVLLLGFEINVAFATVQVKQKMEAQQQTSNTDNQDPPTS
ncbi:YihY/virulence factor BrkB family protein [Eisenibacter elegans]|jgi:membrane protein|uniref:YihY/virulence factor BrkB family protein n=1 Tax=Eisenibacter elegans TaxID=997 RepID=UPI0003FCE4FC|nr:YihY/virulence factor BrkB family protein [Eisenibacter elegans]